MILVRDLRVWRRLYALMLHAILGGEWLRAHDQTAYFWNDCNGFFGRFEGLVSETIYGLLKGYLLALEGLFRTFVGEVKRTDDDLLKAIGDAFARFGNDVPKALGKFRDNAIFNCGATANDATSGPVRLVLVLLCATKSPYTFTSSQIIRREGGIGQTETGHRNMRAAEGGAHSPTATATVIHTTL